MPRRFNTRHKLLYASASEFQWGKSTIARLPRAGNQRAFTRLFSGNGVTTGEVKRKKSAEVPRIFFSNAGSGTARVLKTLTSRRSKRKSVGFLYEKNSSLDAIIRRLYSRK